MASFSYEAVDKSGKKYKGKKDAKDNKDLRNILKKEGKMLIKAKKANSFSLKKNKSKGKSTLFNRVKTKDISLITRQLATMLDSGIALLRAINIIEKQMEKPKLKEIFSSIKNDVSSGITLSSALAKFPKYFDKLYVSMVKAGEASGSLDVVLGRLAQSMEEAEALKGRVKGAMMYPIIVLCVSIIIVIVLMVGVIPRFIEMFEGAGIDMPPFTMFVVNTSNLIASWVGVIAFIGFVIFLVLMTKFIATPKGRHKFDVAVLRLPLVGELLRKVAVARFTRTMGTLLNSGVPILIAFDIASDTSGNTVISNAVTNARDSIREGNTIAKPLEESGEFPIMVTQMIEVGEESGTITEMLNKLSDFLEEEIKEGLQQLVSAMEPLTIVFMAVVIGGIVIALFLPMLSLSDLAG
jgi:type IV pilus assembly protein PilC